MCIVNKYEKKNYSLSTYTQIIIIIIYSCIHFSIMTTFKYQPNWLRAQQNWEKKSERGIKNWKRNTAKKQVNAHFISKVDKILTFEYNSTRKLPNNNKNWTIKNKKKEANKTDFFYDVIALNLAADFVDGWFLSVWSCGLRFTYCTTVEIEFLYSKCKQCMLMLSLKLQYYIHVPTCH